MLNSHVLLDPNGWGSSWFRGDDSRPPANAAPVPDSLRTVETVVPESTDPETGGTVPAHTVETLADPKLLRLVDGVLAAATPADRDEYDREKTIASIPDDTKAAAARLLAVLAEVASEGVDVSASSTTDELFDAIDGSSLSMTKKSYYAAKLMARWKRYSEECGGTWEQMRLIAEAGQ